MAVLGFELPPAWLKSWRPMVLVTCTSCLLASLFWDSCGRLSVAVGWEGDPPPSDLRETYNPRDFEDEDCRFKNRKKARGRVEGLSAPAPLWEHPPLSTLL